ncbi:MAG: DUF3326 domain-containing protein [Cyanobacteria bacterium NC_groundwater_1444_Ag_S-0.65um_54_12]|nr:DUF3326 domain-containing protein [Cyanobacteria bacterium NC_groundwater_1444_Ag_S-0.65um_54_12]
MIRTVSREISWDGDLREIEPAIQHAVAPAYPLRWAITKVTSNSLWAEITILEGLKIPEISATRHMPPNRNDSAFYVVTQLLPTGIGLELGGYAGDGTPATNLLACAADRVVTHPNSVNAAACNWASPNVWYVEGAMLDRWLAGNCALRPSRANRIGLLVDQGVEQAGGLQLLENVANTFRMVGGGMVTLDLTAEPLALNLARGPSGITHGELANPEILLASAKRLLATGAQAIALVGDFSYLAAPIEGYLGGQAPDPLGGLEAILSHFISLALRVPCAHAPFIWPSSEPCDPRAAAEEIGGTYLACVLKGLQRAPRIVSGQDTSPGDLLAPDLVIAPASAMGSAGIIRAACRGIPLLAVQNSSILQVGPEQLGIAAEFATSYLEAAGLVLAYRAGIDPATIRRESGYALARGLRSSMHR